MPLPLLRWRGLTLQMFLFTVLPLAVLLIAIAFGSLSLHHEAMRGLVGDRDLRAVRASSASLAHALEQRSALLEMLAYRASAQPQPLDPRFLDDAAQAYGFDGGLALYGADGRLLAHSANAALDVLAYNTLAAGGQGTPVDDPASVAGLAASGQVQPPRQAADGRWLVPGLARPSGVTALAGAYSPGSLAHEALAGITGGQATLLLISPQGDLLYHFGHVEPGSLLERPGVSDVLRGESGVNYSTGGDGMGSDHSGERVIAFAPVEPVGWGLILEEPWEETASPLLRASGFAPLILAPVLVLALLALWFGARQVVQPLQALEARAGSLASGDFAAIRAPVGGITEIHNLQDALVEMSAALQSAQDALHGYIGALTEGVETERRALARELHDDTLQALIALNQQVQMALLRTTGEAERQALADLQGRVSETIASLRRAIGGLRPIYLEDLGLAAALSMLARETAAARGLDVTFEQEGLERRLPAATELAFYRITQEALNNAAHHAGAQRARVLLCFEAGAARLAVSDNGRGFTVPEDPNAFARLGHFGLLGMRERADLAGAELRIESAPGRGTTVTVTAKDGPRQDTQR